MDDVPDRRCADAGGRETGGRTTQLDRVSAHCAATDPRKGSGSGNLGPRRCRGRAGDTPAQPLPSELGAARIGGGNDCAIGQRSAPVGLQLAADARAGPPGNVDLAGHARPEGTRVPRQKLPCRTRSRSDSDRPSDRGRHGGQLLPECRLRVRRHSPGQTESAARLQPDASSLEADCGLGRRDRVRVGLRHDDRDPMASPLVCDLAECRGWRHDGPLRGGPSRSDRRQGSRIARREAPEEPGRRAT
jgi:hypothetical protein